METISIIGSLCLALCSVPELIRTIKNKKCGIGWGMIGLWYTGEILVFSYLLHKHEHVLCINYTLNMIIVSILIHYKIRYKDN